MGRPRTNKSTIGKDPFDTVIPPRTAIPRNPAVMPQPEPRPELSKPVANRDEPKSGSETLIPVTAVPNRRQKLTVHLDGSLVNRVKNAAYWNPRLTITNIAEQGIRHALREVEKENGGPYKQRESELVGGSQIK
jgi:hypothetical protein